MKTRPTLDVLLFCERVRVEANGAKSLIGIFETLSVSAKAGRPPLVGNLPPVGFAFGIYTRWSNGAGRFVQRVDMTRPDGGTVIVGEALLDFGHALVPHHSFGSISGVFQESGPHALHLYLDNELVMERTLQVAFRVPGIGLSPRQRR